MIKNELPLVSIITPVYNGARYLPDLISSVLSQDYPNLEHIVIDDGSSDNDATIQVLKNYSHLKWWSRPNRGQYATMNEGLLAARGEVVVFVSADDIILPRSISKAVGFLNSHGTIDGVYGNYGFINHEGKILKLFQPMNFSPTKLYSYSLHISHSSLYLRKNLLLANNLIFIETLKFVGDYSWITSLLRAKLKIGRIRENLSMVRIHDEQASKTKFFEMRKEIITVQERLGISPLLASFYRKLWFLINLINAVKISGFKGLSAIITERFRRVNS